MSNNTAFPQNADRKNSITIDFGYSFSKSAIAENSTTMRIVEVAREIRSLIPSVFYIPESGEIQIGDDAELQAMLDPKGIVRSLKASLHRSDRLFRNNRSFKVDELASELFKFIRTESARLYDFDPEHAKCNVVVSACSTIQEKECLGEAATKAGFQDVRMIESPLAGFKHWIDGREEESCPKTAIVVDMGAGAIEFAIIEQAEEGYTIATWFAPDRQAGVNQIDGMIWEKLMSADETPEIPPQEIPGIRIRLRQVKEAFSRNRRPAELLNVNSTVMEVSRLLVEECFNEFFEGVFAGVAGIAKQLSERELVDDAAMLLIGGGAEIGNIESRIRDAGWKGSIEIANQPQFAAVLGAGLEDKFATKTCPEDGSSQPQNAKTCSKCGYPFWKFESSNSLDDSTGRKTCPETECGFENEANYDNCEKCGCPLS